MIRCMVEKHIILHMRIIDGTFIYMDEFYKNERVAMYPSNCIFALILHMRIIDRTRLKLRFLILQVARSLTRCLPSCMFASDQRHPNLVVVVSLWMAT
jgi:hypothetical protein